MLCPWVHNCQAFEIRYHPTTAGLGVCSRCGREWLPNPERLGAIVVHPDGAMCRPRWTAYDALDANKLANQRAGEIINAAQALACDGALERTEPCATSGRSRTNRRRTRKRAGTIMAKHGRTADWPRQRRYAARRHLATIARSGSSGSDRCPY
jgi:hypothetical protein